MNQDRSRIIKNWRRDNNHYNAKNNIDSRKYHIGANMKMLYKHVKYNNKDNGFSTSIFQCSDNNTMVNNKDNGFSTSIFQYSSNNTIVNNKDNGFSIFQSIEIKNHDYHSGHHDSLSREVNDIKDVDVSCFVEHNKYQCVLQREASIIDGTSEHKVVGTFGAGPCVILAGIDSGNKIGFVTHIDSMTNIVQSIRSIFSRISYNYKTSSPLHFNMMIAGGQLGTSEDMINKIVEVSNRDYIQKTAKLDFIGKCVLSTIGSMSLGVDLTTGDFVGIKAQVTEKEKTRLMMKMYDSVKAVSFV